MRSSLALRLSVHFIDYPIFCFFKQKTAYEMRISDWSSDVCSSDLLAREDFALAILNRARARDDGERYEGRGPRLRFLYLPRRKDHPQRLLLEDRGAKRRRDMSTERTLRDRWRCERREEKEGGATAAAPLEVHRENRSEEQTSDIQPLMRISYAVF